MYISMEVVMVFSWKFTAKGKCNEMFPSAEPLSVQKGNSWRLRHDMATPDPLIAVNTGASRVLCFISSDTSLDANAMYLWCMGSSRTDSHLHHGSCKRKVAIHKIDSLELCISVMMRCVPTLPWVLFSISLSAARHTDNYNKSITCLIHADAVREQSPKMVNSKL